MLLYSSTIGELTKDVNQHEVGIGLVEL